MLHITVGRKEPWQKEWFFEEVAEVGQSVSGHRILKTPLAWRQNVEYLLNEPWWVQCFLMSTRLPDDYNVAWWLQYSLMITIFPDEYNVPWWMQRSMISTMFLNVYNVPWCLQCSLMIAIFPDEYNFNWRVQWSMFSTMFPDEYNVMKHDTFYIKKNNMETQCNN